MGSNRLHSIHNPFLFSFFLFPFSIQHSQQVKHLLCFTKVVDIVMHLLRASLVHALFVAFAISQSLPTVNLGYEVHQAITLNVPTYPSHLNAAATMRIC